MVWLGTSSKFRTHSSLNCNNFQKPHGLYTLWGSYLKSLVISSQKYYSISTSPVLESVPLTEVNIQLFFTCFATSLKQATPLSKLGKTTEPYFWYSGTGRIFIVTSVTTPRVPSGRKKN